MSETIFLFAQKQKCASVCCIDEQGNPYCFSCFYAFNSKEGLMYFKSSADSLHTKLMTVKREIAGTILQDSLNLLAIKGIQFQGLILPARHTLINDAEKYYYKKYPLALPMPGELWIIQLNSMKMTDNNMGFGKKIKWNRDE